MKQSPANDESSEPNGGEPAALWNYRAFVATGAFANAGRMTAAPGVVLPYLYVALGAPVAYAGFFAPIIATSRTLGQFFSAPLIVRAQSLKSLSAFLAIALSAALAGIAILGDRFDGIGLAFVLLAGAGLIGLERGMVRLIVQTMIGGTIDAPRRGPLIFDMVLAGGVVGILAVLLAALFVEHESALDSHFTLLWFGAAFSFLTGLAMLVLKEPPSREAVSVKPQDTATRALYFRSLTSGFDLLARNRVLRRFAVARVLFLSIEIASPFFAMHAASLHSHKEDSLSIIVFGTCIALIVGGSIWGRLSRVSYGTPMLAACFVSMIAGIVAIFGEFLSFASASYQSAVVLFLVVLAVQGIGGARKAYIMAFSEPRDLTQNIAAVDLVAGVVGLPFALGLGILAHQAGEFYPILVLLAVNLISVFYVLFVLPRIAVAEKSN